MSPTRPLSLAFAFLLSTAPATGMAEVYKWVDDDGVTHYSQQPPPAGTSTVMMSNPGAPPSSKGKPDAGAAEEPEDGGAGDGDGGPDTMAEFCEGLRDREKVLADDRPIRIKAEDGTLTALDDKGRAQRLERVQGQLREHCQGSEAEGG